MDEGTAAVTHQRPNYVAIFVALAVMTFLEWAVYAIHGLPKAPILLAMAFIKVMLVVLYFMHLRSDNPWYRVVFFAPFLLVIPLMFVAVTQ
jgi:caa(3)-type oxidase subunit IV